MVSYFSEIIKFIRDIYKTPKAFIPLHEPKFIGNEKKYLHDCIESTYVSSIGEYTNRLEEGIAHYTKAKKAVACVNGTNALHLSLKLVGVNDGDEVITQPLTFIATVNAICYCMAKPVFIDIDKDTLGLSPQALHSWLKENVEMREDPAKLFSSVESIPYNKYTNRRISACVPMHTFGHPCKITEIVSICDNYNIPVIEDAAESLGSFYKDQHTGTFGKIGVISFNGNKIITTGGGGMLLFNDDNLAIRAKHLSTQAKIPHPWKFVHDEIGYNYRMPNINAALGVAQLEQLEGFIQAKRKLAKAYSNFFATTQTTPCITYFNEPTLSKSNYWLNAILFENERKRNEFLKYTNKKGIMTRPAWELINRLAMFKDAQSINLENAEWIADRLVNIPSSVI